MKRYLVERTFPNGLALPADAAGAEVCRKVVARNAEEQVTRVHSYVTPDRTKTYCIYDAPDPEAIRRVAERRLADRPHDRGPGSRSYFHL